MFPRIHVGEKGSGHDNESRTGGEGGMGQGFKAAELLVSIREGGRTAVRDLDMKMDIFCHYYGLGQELAGLLQTHHFKSPASLLHVTNVELLEDGFKIGHVAELKRALRQMVGKELDEGGGCKPELIGGIGDKGGHGGQVGGKGGDGEASKVPPTLHSRFGNISGKMFHYAIWDSFTEILLGGFGGEGGTSGCRNLQTPRVPNEATAWSKIQKILRRGAGGQGGTSRQNSQTPRDPKEVAAYAVFQTMIPFSLNIDAGGTWITGGVGGMGGNGTHRGGKGGIGEASDIPIGRVSFYTKIFGGIGGEGGTGGHFGGTGGKGQGTAFHEPLGNADGKTLTAKPLSDLLIDENLRKRLRQQGFITAGALFFVTGRDLLDIDDFKRGDIGALKDALANLRF
ncbi:hypothetical protein MSAN_01198200 [Mycena sanguinolenta]|uniref:Uncharacterized protein n=1 Tax=Mycena sanguinolenta TaxID=230812 RepID=A0A8H6YHD8_9AGAR|nr:hypothetical protein MSAN_01198200 [Mycena sanguinolenta]